MKKIPTMFERDWHGDRSRVLDKPNPECAWVFDGEGVATRKYDGMCTAVIDGKLWKRREMKPGQTAPPGWVPLHLDEVTGKETGWVPVGDGPEDKYLREARENSGYDGYLEDGTYEFLGPKSQGNIEKFDEHTLVRHGSDVLTDVPRTFDGLHDYLHKHDIEGIVFHHPDGRMAKIKGRDFGADRALLRKLFPQ